MYDYTQQEARALEISMLKQQLAAAQAELAAEKLSNQIDAACAEQFQDAMQRAEQAEAQCAAQKKRLTMYKDCLYIPTGEITKEYIGEFLNSLPVGSIWHFIASKWDALVKINNQQQNEIEIMEIGLKSVVYPMQYLREYAELEGAKLDPMWAIQIINRPEWYQNQAKKTLDAIKQMKEGQ